MTTSWNKKNKVTNIISSNLNQVQIFQIKLRALYKRFFFFNFSRSSFDRFFQVQRTRKAVVQQSKCRHNSVLQYTLKFEIDLRISLKLHINAEENTFFILCCNQFVSNIVILFCIFQEFKCPLELQNYTAGEYVIQLKTLSLENMQDNLFMCIDNIRKISYFILCIVFL